MNKHLKNPMNKYVYPHALKKVQQVTVLLVTLLAISACSSTPLPPERELQAAELAITSAEQARVAEYASPELNEAREKLDAAHVAVQQKNMVLATYLANESTAGAQLASARAEMLKAKEVNDEMQESINTLKVELLRNSGAR
jgi:hypothetical protein